MDGAWASLGPIAAAALMLLLAALLLWLDAGNRAARAFVAFLVLRAGILTTAAFAPLADGATETALASAVVYYDIGLAAAAIWFLSSYPRPRGPLRTRAGTILIVTSSFAAMVAYALEPCLVLCDSAVQPGPLVFILITVPTASGFGAAVLYRDAAREPRQMQRASLALMATGFWIESAIGAGRSVAFLRDTATDPRFLGVTFLPLLGTIFASSACVLAFRGQTSRLAGLSALGATAAAAGALSILSQSAIASAAVDVLRLALPLLTTYALMRHRLFDIDLKVRVAARRATIGAVFAGVFFVVTEGAVYALGSRYGVFAGILAVGALVPLMGPLRRAAERVTDLLPGDDVPPRELPLERRRQIYLDFLIQAWSDGDLAREERAFLDDLRLRLALPTAEAYELELEAVTKAHE